jgi:hypothetical protein
MNLETIFVMKHVQSNCERRKNSNFELSRKSEHVLFRIYSVHTEYSKHVLFRNHGIYGIYCVKIEFLILQKNCSDSNFNRIFNCGVQGPNSDHPRDPLKWSLFRCGRYSECQSKKFKLKKQIF